MTELSVVTARDRVTGAYRPAEHVAFVFSPEGEAFALDMAGDVFALDSAAARIIRDAVAGDLQSSATNEQFLEELVRTGLLVRDGKAGAPVKSTASASLLARLATSLLRRGLAVRLALMLARIGIRRDGWATTFLLWRRHAGERRERISADEIEQLVARASAGDLSGADCKERALCAWALAKQSGLPATITIGVALHPLAGHSWCRSGDRILGDSAARVARYTPALSYA